MATIALCMIVKDEAGIVARCIKSALPLIDFVLIGDTVSRDGTKEVIRHCLREAGMPGEVIEEPWRDFAYNRTFALERLREHADIDYALINDADDQIVFDGGFDAAAFKAGIGEGSAGRFLRKDHPAQSGSIPSRHWTRLARVKARRSR